MAKIKVPLPTETLCHELTLLITCTGELLCVCVLSPNCPYPFDPQTHNVPSFLIAATTPDSTEIKFQFPNI
jgi:hypothetical protein